MPTTHQTDDINIYKINIIKRKKIEKKERIPLPRIRSQIQKAIDSWKGIRSRLYKSNKRPIAGGGAQALGRNLLLLLY